MLEAKYEETNLPERELYRSEKLLWIKKNRKYDFSIQNLGKCRPRGWNIGGSEIIG